MAVALDRNALQIHAAELGFFARGKDSELGAEARGNFTTDVEGGARAMRTVVSDEDETREALMVNPRPSDEHGHGGVMEERGRDISTKRSERPVMPWRTDCDERRRRPPNVLEKPPGRKAVRKPNDTCVGAQRDGFEQRVLPLAPDGLDVEGSRIRQVANHRRLEDPD